MTLSSRLRAVTVTSSITVLLARSAAKTAPGTKTPTARAAAKPASKTPSARTSKNRLFIISPPQTVRMEQTS